jgi:hypothetical protein
MGHRFVGQDQRKANWCWHYLLSWWGQILKSVLKVLHILVLMGKLYKLYNRALTFVRSCFCLSGGASYQGEWLEYEAHGYGVETSELGIGFRL